MIFAVLNAVFAWIFFSYARYALPQGTRFVRVGWMALSAHVPHYRDNNIVTREAISEGGRFVLGGSILLVTGAIAAVLAVVFGFQVVLYTFGGLINPA